MLTRLSRRSYPESLPDSPPRMVRSLRRRHKSGRATACADGRGSPRPSAGSNRRPGQCCCSSMPLRGTPIGQARIAEGERRPARPGMCGRRLELREQRSVRPVTGRACAFDSDFGPSPAEQGNEPFVDDAVRFLERNWLSEPTGTALALSAFALAAVGRPARLLNSTLAQHAEATSAFGNVATMGLAAHAINCSETNTASPVFTLPQAHVVTRLAMPLSRRKFLAASAGLALGAAGCQRPRYRPGDFTLPTESPIVALAAPTYDVDFGELVGAGLRELQVDVRGKRVLLKPNLVEYEPGTVINTHPHVVVRCGDRVSSRRRPRGDCRRGPGPPARSRVPARRHRDATERCRATRSASST